MKKNRNILYILFLLVLLVTCQSSINHDEWCSDFEVFKQAIVKVESNGNPKSLAKDGSAGILQIQPCLVHSVNNYYRRSGYSTRFTLKDRFNVEKSWKMFYAYQQIIWKGDRPTFEQMARCWNGGPRGHKKKCTEKYWNKIHREMVKIKSKTQFNNVPQNYLYTKPHSDLLNNNC